MKTINGILAAAVSSLVILNLPTAAMATNVQVYEAFTDDSELELVCVDPNNYRAFYKNGNMIDNTLANLDLDDLFGQASTSGKIDHGAVFMLNPEGLGHCQVTVEEVRATITG
jgi:hypothetical protein